MTSCSGGAGLLGCAVLAIVALSLAGCSSPEPGTLEGTAAACSGIYPVNGSTPQDVGTLRLQVVVMKGRIRASSIVASQQLQGTLTNSFRPSYRLSVPPGRYRVVADPEVNLPWEPQTRWLQVKSGATTHWAFGCSEH
jgi:hypothetical protein